MSAWLYDWSAPVYNAISRLLFFEDRIRARSIAALELEPGFVVLDLGCGTGFHFPALRRALGPHGRVVGVDASRASIEVARLRAASLGLAFEGVSGDAARMPAVPDRYDAVIAVFALSVIEGWEEACARAVASLKPGGRFVVLEQRFAERGWGRLINPLARAANRLLGASASRDFEGALSRLGLEVEQVSLLYGLYAIVIGVRPRSITT